jgi:GxxExxY protein
VHKLEIPGVPSLDQQEVVIDYKGTQSNETPRFDSLVDGCLLVEIKAVQEILPIHKAQLPNSIKLLRVPPGLSSNFQEITLVEGVSRLILPQGKQVLNRSERRKRRNRYSP